MKHLKSTVKPMNKKPLIQYKQVEARYGSIQALRGIDLEIFEGEIVTLIGANGAGKSTLMMSLFSQPRIHSGSIWYRDTRVDHLPTHAISALNISVSPEGRRIFPKMTTLENLELGAMHCKDADLNQKTLKKVYALFPVLKDRKLQRAGTLSGGEQQMLAIGRSLMAQPKVFLLDEPSLGLAPQVCKQIFETLKEINELGTTIFLVEQNAFAALKLAHRGYVLTNGEITMQGSSKELANNDEIKKAYLGH